MKDTELERSKVRIIGRELSDWKVCLQEILNVIVKDSKEHDEAMGIKIFEATVGHIIDIIGY
jgi:hypothetical protein